MYANSVLTPPLYGYSSFKPGWNKCNLFVAHGLKAAGLPVPSRASLLGSNVYPPVANDWANGHVIDGWLFLGREVLLQPGYVVGHPAYAGSGHCGIVDFDGRGIAAGKNEINRRYVEFLDGSCGYNKLLEANE